VRGPAPHVRRDPQDLGAVERNGLRGRERVGHHDNRPRHSRDLRASAPLQDRQNAALDVLEVRDALGQVGVAEGPQSLHVFLDGPVDRVFRCEAVVLDAAKYLLAERPVG